MSQSDQEQQPQPRNGYQPDDVALVLPLGMLDRTLFPVVGGKATNLGELIQAGFPVPAGFCVTTTAYTLFSERAGLEPILEELAAQVRTHPTHQRELAAAARAALLQAPLPSEVVQAVTSAYLTLFQGVPFPVAVRSSATAEDLPSASFAGQQETFLNIIGIEANPGPLHRAYQERRDH